MGANFDKRTVLVGANFDKRKNYHPQKGKLNITSDTNAMCPYS